MTASTGIKTDKFTHPVTTKLAELASKKKKKIQIIKLNGQPLSQFSISAELTIPSINLLTVTVPKFTLEEHCDKQ